MNLSYKLFYRLFNKLSYRIDDQNFLTFSTRRNRKIGLTEYYDLLGVSKESPQIPPQYIQDFEVDGYYIYPELGVMMHCMLITDNSHTHNNELMFIMEDQFGNIFSVTINDPENVKGWRFLEKQVFIEIVKKGLPEPEPPRVS